MLTGPLFVAVQTKTRLSKSCIMRIPPFKGAQQSQTILVAGVLGLLDALNLLVPSILPYDHGSGAEKRRPVTRANG